MPIIARVFIKASLVYLVLAMLAGILLSVQALGSGGVVVSGVFPVYIHLLVIGWITQLIFGVAIWMFPKFSMEKPRRSDPLSWFSFYTLNAGLFLRIIAEPLNSAAPAPLWGWSLAVSSVLLFACGLAFVVNVWQRVKEH